MVERESPCGGIGRRARLKIEFRKECWFDSGQGHQAENTNRNNSLSHWFDSIFLKKFSSFVESADKKLAPAVQLVGIFVGIGKLNDRGEFRYSERRNRADGPQERWRGRQPKADLIDVDCRATEIRHGRRTARAFRLAHEADAASGLVGSTTGSIPRRRCRSREARRLESPIIRLVDVVQFNPRQAHVIVVDACA